jgi:hypothetical protein
MTKSEDSFQQLIALVSSIYSEYEELRLTLTNSIHYSQQLFKFSLNEKQAMIDAEVAKVYGLSLNDLKYILDQFHIRDTKKEKKLTLQKKLIFEQFKGN